MIVNYFDEIYSSIKGRSKVAALKRFMTRVISNLWIPINFRLTKRRQNKNDRNEFTEKQVIVSLTSFPARIHRVWLVVECMLRQNIKPDIIILYLAESQFPNREKELPKNLINYVKNKQLKIEFVDDLRSHKKYFYSFQDYVNDLVVLIDDDIFYPSCLIENLLTMYKEHPNSIICSRAYKVKKKEDKLLPYESWNMVKKFESFTYSLFHTSGGGTLYSPSLFDKDLYDKEVFLKYCKFADDVWLNIQAQRNNIYTVKTSGFSEILPILNFNKVALKQHNVASGGNDTQLKNLIEYYELKESTLFL